ncbi:PREDICTED: T-lymphocyte activation antigen CD86 isoform X2 [Dipodomys ordii]|uniref:T-lymphocyte activation antigen CD86 n=1 Tax=Dipodomys ordii TaxID=10020 RepID=A0A1S3FEM7_DIPOR|nr:PREDICTED: T-lymphocyte activation antigen CD86 isoform X2 [Dipodomys ordii]
MGIDDSCRAMGLRLALLVIAAFLLRDAASVKIQAYFNETAELPCQFVNSQNLNLTDLVVFWQNQERMVLYEAYKGKYKPEHVNVNYIGRTSFDQDNWILRLHGIQIKDQGLYQCFIHHMKNPGGMVRVHQNNCELSVLAHFSKPEIVLTSNITRYSTINVTCSSKQGYPKPLKMFFQLVTENSTSDHHGNMMVSQDNVTKLFNLSLSLSVPIPAGEVNVTIFCILKTESMELSSSLLLYRDPMDPLPDTHQVTWIAIAIICGITLGCGIGVYLKRCRNKKQQQFVIAYKETTKPEGEDNEEMGEREKIHIQESKDEEILCDIHSAKIPSNDQSATHL